jgi:hypothetical protein
MMRLLIVWVVSSHGGLWSVVLCGAPATPNYHYLQSIFCELTGLGGGCATQRLRREVLYSHPYDIATTLETLYFGCCSGRAFNPPLDCGGRRLLLLFVLPSWAIRRRRLARDNRGSECEVTSYPTTTKYKQSKPLETLRPSHFLLVCQCEVKPSETHPSVTVADVPQLLVHFTLLFQKEQRELKKKNKDWFDRSIKKNGSDCWNRKGGGQGEI